MTSGKHNSNPSKTFTCKYCGDTFYRIVCPSSKGLFLYCSPSCRNKARKLKDIECPVCHKMFKPNIIDISGQRKRYCSQECARNDLCYSDEIKQFVIDTYPTQGSRPTIDKYSIPHQRVQNLAYRLGVKLNNDIYYDTVHNSAKEYMLNNNPMHNKKTVKKVQEFYKKNPEKKLAIMHKRNKTRSKNKKFKDTSLELKMKSILNNLGIEYEYQVPIKPKFLVDFKIDNLIIQTDGDYWHGHKRFKPLTQRQIKQQKRDVAQDKYLTTCGYIVVRIWESDLSKQLVIKLLKEHNILR